VLEIQLDKRFEALERERRSGYRGFLSKIASLMNMVCAVLTCCHESSVTVLQPSLVSHVLQPLDLEMLRLRMP